MCAHFSCGDGLGDRVVNRSDNNRCTYAIQISLSGRSNVAKASRVTRRVDQWARYAAITSTARRGPLPPVLIAWQGTALSVLDRLTARVKDARSRVRFCSGYRSAERQRVLGHVETDGRRVSLACADVFAISIALGADDVDRPGIGSLTVDEVPRRPKGSVFRLEHGAGLQSGSEAHPANQEPLVQDEYVPAAVDRRSLMAESMPSYSASERTRVMPPLFTSMS